MGFRLIAIGIMGLFLTGVFFAFAADPKSKQELKTMSQVNHPITKSEEEWKSLLNPEVYSILREKGTERAFTGKYYNNRDTGHYHCAGCGALLFSSQTKYNSGSGWPSFWNAADPNAIKYIEDTTLGMTRIEVQCAKCGGHLGHVFEDGPLPTGKRYCINSASMQFTPLKK